MIEELIAKTFETRNFAHKAHLNTRVYAQHMALGEFYEDLIEAVDAVVEAWQGMFGLIDADSFKTAEPKGNDFDITGSVIPHLRDESDWIEVNRDEIAGSSNAVANLVDGVTAVYLKAIYKLENLA